MPVAPDDDNAWPGRPQASLAALLDAATAAVAQLAGQADLDRMADQDAAAVMGALTTLTGRLDGLRVQVARAVRDRDICRLRGARNLAGWLRADARLADDAWKIARLAAAGPGLPQITALLGAGTISLAQAATASWQITQLPAVPRPPAVITPAEPGPTPAEPDPTPAEPRPHSSRARPRSNRTRPHSSRARRRRTRALRRSRAGWHRGIRLPGRAAQRTRRQRCRPCAQLPAGVDPSGEEAWAGLWRAGDVHAAADALFATVLPALDGAQLRQLGAHLREAADARDRATEDCDAYVRRSLRISRSLHGIAEITGRLHPEAAEQVIAAFEYLGRRTGPDDDRTKAQRWADALAWLTAAGPSPSARLTAAGPATPPVTAGPASRSAQPGGRHRSRRDARTAGRLWRRGRRPAQPCPRVHRARPRRPGPRRRRRTRQPCSA